MDTTILAAIIGGVCTITAVFIAYFLSKKRKEKESEEPQTTQTLTPGQQKVTVQVKIPTTPAAEKPTVTGEIPIPPKPYFAHPYPLQENFTGRLSEREELTEWFTKGSCPMFAYVAIGGMGKSALTWYWLHEDIIKKGLAPKGIIWWSFYDREARFETFLMKAIQYVSKGEIDAKKIDSTRDRMETLNTLLSNNRFLLVLDGVERVLRAYAGLGSPYQGDEVKKDEKEDYRACTEPNVGTFLQWLASGKTKTLLTSRLCPKELDAMDGCFCMDLTKMNKEDAVDFFRRQGVKKGTRAEIENVCDYFGYHPLSLRLLSGMIVKDPKVRGDIATWARHNPIHELKAKKHHILQLAYNSLDPQKRSLISKLSAFRNPMDYDSISIFNEFETEEKFDEALIELVERGLMLRDAETNKYDLHPIVRRYYYDRLMNKKGVHSQLRDYFAKAPEPEKVESLEDLAPVVELYHHTVNSGRYDEAYSLLVNRLVPNPLHFQLGAYQLIIELERTFFDDDEYKICKLKDDSKRAWLYNSLANSYSFSGQPEKAVRLLGEANELVKGAGDKKSLARGLSNLADDNMKIGDFKSTESNLWRSIDVCQEIKDEFWKAADHIELGRLLAHQGKFEESEKELTEALELFIKRDEVRSQGVVWAYYSVRALLISDVDKALKAAKKARKLADAEKLERDIIRAEWLLGAAHLAKGDLKEAAKHLNEALVRDRRINMVELEPDILLELAKLRFKQGHKEEALKLAKEALGIADRCEYRLKQADIHNFLTEFYLDAKDFSKAKEHVEIAKERAECGYVPAMKKAEELSRLVNK